MTKASTAHEPRIGSIQPEDYSPEQRDMFDGITGGARAALRPKKEFLNDQGGVGGPFHPWIHSPTLGFPTQALGAKVRFENTLSGDLRELAILVVGAYTHAEYEWWAHSKIGLKEGLTEDMLAAISETRAHDDEQSDWPPFETDAQRVVYEFALELTQTSHVTEARYTAVQQLLGDQQTVDLVITIGYYTLVSMTLNTFQIQLPDGVKPAFS